MYIYEGHLGSIYASQKLYDFKDLYCEQCGDYDNFLGEADTRAEAWELLKDITDTFDIAMCKGCSHQDDDDYCDNECEHYKHSGGYSYDYVMEFIRTNFKG